MKNNWEILKLVDVCTIGDGNHSSKYPKSNEMVAKGVPFIRANNLVNGQVSMIDMKYITKEKHANLKKGHLKTGDILFTNRGEIGKIAILSGDFNNSNLNSQIAWFRCLEKLNNRFLFYFLLSPAMKNHFSVEKNGAALQQLTIKQINDLSIPIPPLPVQDRIVAIIDDAFAAIDNAKENTEKNLKNSREIFESYLENIFANPRKEWKKKIFSEVCEISSKLIDPREAEFHDLFHIGGANIESKTGALLNLQTAREEKLISGKFAFDQAMVLYSKIRPYLIKVTRPDFSGLCSADIYPLKPFPDEITKDFLYYILISAGFTKYAIEGSARAGMPKVNREHLFAFQFNCPTVPEQNVIVSKLDALSEEASKLEAIYQQKLVNLEELKKSILQKAFNGELP